jgi:Uma2 family endonuclease
MTEQDLLEKTAAANGSLPPLVEGERLDQRTFHARYEAMPPHVRAELVGGIVYMPSPLGVPHGRHHGLLMTWLGTYAAETPGTDVLNNATTILNDENEPQPDGNLIILPEYGGQTSVTEDEYLQGTPELIAEVSDSSELYDLKTKKLVYEQAGVLEYVVVVVRKEIVWHVRRHGAFVPLDPGPDGIYRSEVFPGLWLDGAAMLARDSKRVLQVLQQGLATPEHARFVEELAKRKRA